ncbi:MAG: LptA/OstA family protein [bacterium]|nr:LptA/OstA family protein [bacterium]
MGRAVLFLLLFTCGFSAAQEEKSSAKDIADAEIKRLPTVITCEGPLNVDYNNNIVILNRNVLVEDKYGTIRADKIKIIFNKDEKKIERIEALGSVVIKQEDKTASCGEAVFLMDSRTVVLKDNPVVNRGTDTLAGEKIIFFIDENRMVCEPGAKLVIFPERNKNMKELTIF